MRTGMGLLRQKVRSLGRSGGYTAVAVLTLALAVGGVVASFSVLDGVVLKPLPFEEPDRLVQVTQRLGDEDGRGMAPADIELLLERVDAFQAVGWFREPSNMALTGDGRPEVVRGREVSASLFRVLGRDAAVGRTFRPEEGEAGADGVALLTHALWSRRFAADPAVVGTTVVLDGRPRTVVGVLPAELAFDVEGGQDLFVPRVFDPTSGNYTGWFSDAVVGRLAPGVSRAAAQAELEAWARALEEEFPTRRTDVGVAVRPLRALFLGDVRPVVYTLFAAGLLVLLVAGANLTHLTLARLTERASGLAVRTALGARPGRLLAEQAVEAGLLTAGGLTGGVLLASLLLPAFLALAPAEVAGLSRVALDGRAVAFALALAAALTALLATVPTTVVLPRARSRLAGGRPGGGRRRGGRTAVVVGEAALVSALLLVLVLLGRSFQNARAVDPGFDTSAGLAVQITVPAERYPGVAEIQGFYARVVEELKALPGVMAVGGVSTLPLSGEGITIPAPVAEGDVLTGPAVATRPRTGWNGVTPDYFDAMGIPLLEGRRFHPSDAEDSVRVIAVNETFARAVFGDASPVGRRVGFGTPPSTWMEVVAVVGDVRHDDLRAPPRLAFYQYAPETTFAWPTMELVVRGAAGALPSAEVVREVVQRVDPDQPVSRIRTLDAVWADSLAEARFQLLLLGLFGFTALALGLVGISGVVAHATRLRTREMGVRIALGAEPAGVLRLVVREAVVRILAGVAVGSAAGMAVGHLLRESLYGVAPTDAEAATAVALLLVLLGAAAAWLPARAVSRADPVAALRAE